jgi:hypothetical protein
MHQSALLRARPPLAAAWDGCLLANFIACAAWLATLQQQKNPSPRRASSLREVLHLKNKNFFRKEARPLCRKQQVKGLSVRHAPPLAGQASKQKHGAGVVRARPPHKNLSAGKIWCGQILPLCSKKEQKIKKC